jgi:hypothetical protein
VLYANLSCFNIIKKVWQEKKGSGTAKARLTRNTVVINIICTYWIYTERSRLGAVPKSLSSPQKKSNTLITLFRTHLLYFSLILQCIFAISSKDYIVISTQVVWKTTAHVRLYDNLTGKKVPIDSSSKNSISIQPSGKYIYF